MKQIIIILAIALGTIGLGVILFLKGNTKPEELPQMGQEIEIQTGSHIPEGQAHDPYNSNPPTSGPHYAQPANWGVYTTVMTDEQVIHNLEHGGIWITYKDLDQDSINRLDEIARRNSSSVVLSPRPTGEAKISIASWGRLDKLESVDQQRISDFIKANKNKSPEKLAR